MQINKITKFIYEHIKAGLALAFIVLILLFVLYPQILKGPGSIVKYKEARTIPVENNIVPTSLSGPASYSDAVKSAAPAVVNIYTTKVVTQRIPLMFDDPIFKQFFGNLVVPRKRLENSLGSGVIISDDGYLLTNYHVVKDAEEILVAMQDGRTVSAVAVGADADTDLAVLKIDLKDLPSITLGHSENLQVGDVVLAIGNPFGVGQTVTLGIISATGRTDLGINTFENFIQTDAAINPGNSGGGLINAYGHLVGINTAIFSRSGGSQGIGFAIPIDLAKSVMNQIITHGYVKRGWIGIDAQNLSPSLAETFGLDELRGTIITNTLLDGPARQADLKPGDVIIQINNEPVHDAKSGMNIITRTPPGKTVTVHVIRNGKTIRVPVKVGQRPIS
jgi:serine protease DegS